MQPPPESVENVTTTQRGAYHPPVKMFLLQRDTQEGVREVVAMRQASATNASAVSKGTMQSTV